MVSCDFFVINSNNLKWTCVFLLRWSQHWDQRKTCHHRLLRILVWQLWCSWVYYPHNLPLILQLKNKKSFSTQYATATVLLSSCLKRYMCLLKNLQLPSILHQSSLDRRIKITHNSMDIRKVLISTECVLAWRVCHLSWTVHFHQLEKMLPILRLPLSACVWTWEEQKNIYTSKNS